MQGLLQISNNNLNCTGSLLLAFCLLTNANLLSGNLSRLRLQ